MNPHRPHLMLPLIIASTPALSTWRLMRCSSTLLLLPAAILVTIGVPPTPRRHWRCPASTIHNWRIAFLPRRLPFPFGASRQCAGAAQGMFLFTPPPPPQFTFGCASDRGGEDSHTPHPWGNWEGNCSYFCSPAHPFSRCDAQVWVRRSDMGKCPLLSPRQIIWLQLFGIPPTTLPLFIHQTNHDINVVPISFTTISHQSSRRAWRIPHVLTGAHAPADCNGQGAHSRATWDLFPWWNLGSSHWVLPTSIRQSTTL